MADRPIPHPSKSSSKLVEKSGQGNPQVRFEQITENNEGQRVDNFLLAKLKGVPKSRIYRLLRKGEVRVNKGRVKPEYKLQADDVVRIPPVRVAEKEAKAMPGRPLRKVLSESILFEDARLLVLNKPSGLAVHGGSGFDLGVIESLRAIYSEQPYLELVHRIDKGTSGCLLVAKKRSCLRHVQDQMRRGNIEKEYLALVEGHWKKGLTRVAAPLKRNAPNSGERIVRVAEGGKPSATRFRVVQRYKEATLLACRLETGRTHQIRVHCQFSGHPLAGDSKYGDEVFNRQMKAQGNNRLFLHAARIAFVDADEQKREFAADLPDELQAVLDKLEKI